MKYCIIPLLMGTLSSLGVASEPELLLDIDFAAASENVRGTLIVPNSEKADASSGEDVTVVAKTLGGNAYTLDDVASEDGRTFLKSQPERKSYLEVVLPESTAPGNDNFSVAFWFKPAARETVPGFLLSAGTSAPTWILQSTDDDHLRIMFDGHSGDGTGRTLTHTSKMPLNPGEWNHVAVVFDRNDSILVYLNGTLDSYSQPISSHPEAMPGRIYLAGPYEYSSGDFGRIRLFRGKLSEDQIQKLANAQDVSEYTGVRLTD